MTSSTLPRIGQGSLSDQTARALLEAILNRQFAGDRLPNEPDLAEQMAVSRTTIRAALQALERLGVISRAPGRGTRIRPQVGRDCMLLHRLIGFQGMLESRYTVTTQQSFHLSDVASDQLTEALGVGRNTPVLVNDKTLLADGRPAVHLLQEVPLANVRPGLAEQLVDGSAVPPRTIFELSEQWPGHEIDSTVVTIIPRIVPETDAFPLPIAPGTPCLELRETHYSDANEPVAIGREVFDDDIVSLRVVRSK